MTNGRFAHAGSRAGLHEGGSGTSRSDNSGEDDVSDGGQDQGETHTSTSTDEPTIRGPRTVVGWEGRSSP
jgi:hypothetical protein